MPGLVLLRRLRDSRKHYFRFYPPEDQMKTLHFGSVPSQTSKENISRQERTLGSSISVARLDIPRLVSRSPNLTDSSLMSHFHGFDIFLHQLYTKDNAHHPEIKVINRLDYLLFQGS